MLCFGHFGHFGHRSAISATVRSFGVVIRCSRFRKLFNFAKKHEKPNTVFIFQTRKGDMSVFLNVGGGTSPNLSFSPMHLMVQLVAMVQLAATQPPLLDACKAKQNNFCRSLRFNFNDACLYNTVSNNRNRCHCLYGFITRTSTIYVQTFIDLSFLKRLF